MITPKLQMLLEGAGRLEILIRKDAWEAPNKSRFLLAFLIYFCFVFRWRLLCIVDSECGPAFGLAIISPHFWLAWISPVFGLALISIRKNRSLCVSSIKSKIAQTLSNWSHETAYMLDASRNKFLWQLGCCAHPGRAPSTWRNSKALPFLKFLLNNFFVESCFRYSSACGACAQHGSHETVG